MFKDINDGISHLIEQELHSTDKFLKPDFSQKTGRELLAFYLQSKFKQVLAYDTKSAEPIFIDVRYDFIQRFSKRLISNPDKRILIGITGESASGKSTICREISNVISMLQLLSSGRKYSINELANTLEVTPRMIRVYKEELEKAGMLFGNVNVNVEI